MIMQAKKVKLFGFELSIDVDECSKSCEGKLGDTKKYLCFEKPEGAVEANLDIGDRLAEAKRKERVVTKKYECQFCFREFANSQALGGHQNAHKKERQMKKRLQMQARKASLNCCHYFHPLQSYGFKRHGVVHPWNPWSYVTEFLSSTGETATASGTLSRRIIGEFRELRTGSFDEGLHRNDFFLPSPSSTLSSETSKKELLDFSSWQSKSFSENCVGGPLLLVQHLANQ